MKLAIMQPYFFPYAGYFSLMMHCDKLLLFDAPQYDRKGWMHRNRIFKEPDGWRYIHLGIVKPQFSAAIKDVLIDKSIQWKIDILQALLVYKYAPHYTEVINLIKVIFDSNCTTLVEFNNFSLSAIRDYLSIECPITIYSSLNLGLAYVEHPGQWAVKIAHRLGADEYVNPHGGVGIFQQKEFDELGISLSFLKHNLQPYPRGGRVFEPGLSIIDVLMFCSKKEVNDYLKNYNIYRKSELVD